MVRGEGGGDGAEGRRVAVEMNHQLRGLGGEGKEG